MGTSRRGGSRGAAPSGRNGPEGDGSLIILFQVLGQVLVHLEHRHLLLAEHRLELFVGEDLALVLRVLQLVLLDVVPHLADDLRPRQRRRADDGAELLRGLQRLHQGPIGLALAGGLGGFCCGFRCHGSPPGSGLPPRISGVAGRSTGTNSPDPPLVKAARPSGNQSSAAFWRYPQEMGPPPGVIGARPWLAWIIRNLGLYFEAADADMTDAPPAGRREPSKDTMSDRVKPLAEPARPIA